MTEREQKIKDALNALEGALKYAKHQYEYSKEPVTHGDLIAPILTAMIVLCDLQKESPRPDWTPCAEGLPTPDAEENGVRKRYLCTTSTPSGKFVVVELIYITIGEKPVWYDNDYYELFEGSGYQVTAWMPRPEPYNTDRKEDAKSDDVSQWPDWKKRAALSNYDFKKEDSE